MLFYEIPSQIRVATAPAMEPVSLEELKAQLRIEPSVTDEDTWLRSLLSAAREFVENDTRRALISTQYYLYLDQFPYWGQLDRQSIERTSQAVGVFYGGGIELRRCPVISVDALTYLDTTGTTQTLDLATKTYADIASEPGRLYPAYGVAWPISRWQANAVRVTFTAGYGSTPDNVPAMAKHAIRLLASHWYWNREAVGKVGAEIDLSYQALVTRLKWSLN